MPHFVYDDTALFFPKTNLAPIPSGANDIQWVQDIDWNTLNQAVVDIKELLRGAVQIGFEGQASDPAPVGIDNYLWLDTSDDLFIHTGGQPGVNVNLSAGGGGGEINTADNVNVGGVGVYKQKVGVELQFKGINQGSSKISVTDEVGNNEIDIDVVEANVIHDNLSGSGSLTHAQIDTQVGLFTSVAQGSVWFSDGADPAALAPGTAGQFLKTQGAAADAIWADATLAIQDEGSPVTNTPHTTINFVGTGVSVADAGTGVSTVTIPGALGNSLDGAYDFGGAHLGRTINVDDSFPVELAQPAVGTTTSDAKVALHLHNITDAAAGAQQHSPMLLLEGQGWETTGGTTKEVQYAQQVVPVQDTEPRGDLTFFRNFNNTGFKKVATIGYRGASTTPEFIIGDADAAYTGVSVLTFKTNTRIGDIRVDQSGGKMTFTPVSDGNGFFFGTSGSLASLNSTALTTTVPTLVMADTDSTHIFGKARFDQRAAGAFSLSHYAHTAIQSFAIDQTLVGDTRVNAVGGRTLSLCVQSVNKLNVATSAITYLQDIGSLNANGAAIRNIAATATVPTLIPDKSNIDTGIGYTADAPTMVINTTQVMKWQATSILANVNFNLFKVDLLHAGATSGTLTHSVPATVTDYTIIWPNAQASGTQLLENDGAGNLSWATAGAGGSTLDGAYDFGGAHLGRTINVDDSFPVELAQPAVGATTSDVKVALHLHNSTPSAGTGAQQYSPMLHMQGSGWKTDATAGPMDVEFAQQVIPVEGTAAPTGDWVLFSNINDAGYTEALRVTSAGAVLHQNGSTSLPSVSFAESPTIGLVRSGTSSFLMVTGLTRNIQVSQAGLAPNNVSGLLGSASLPWGGLHVKGSRVQYGATSGSITHTVPATVTTYSLDWPSADTAGALTSDGAGNLSWTPAAGGLTVGDAITSGTANRVLYEDSGNLLAESASLTFDGTTIGTAQLDVAGSSATTYGIDITTDYGEWSGSRWGTVVGIEAYETGAPVAYELHGHNVNLSVGSSNTQNWTAVAGLQGYSSDLSTSPGSTGVLTGAAHFYVNNMGVSGATVTNQYGFYSEALTGATNNYVAYLAGNTDAQAIIGRCRIDSRLTDRAYFSHFDQATTSVYALRHTSVGVTTLNCNSGQTINLAINNSAHFTMDATSGFYANNAGGPSILNAAASSTVPTLIPDRVSTITGWGGDAATPDISGIVSSVEKINIAASLVTLGLDVGLKLDQTNTIPGGAPGADKGTIWLRDDTPNNLIFTDDVGTTFVLNRWPSSSATAASYTHLVTDSVILCDRAGVITVNLVAAATCGDGYIVYIKDISGLAATNNITVDASGTEKIDDALTKVINVNYAGITLFCDGSNWWII